MRLIASAPFAAEESRLRERSADRDWRFQLCGTYLDASIERSTAARKQPAKQPASGCYFVVDYRGNQGFRGQGQPGWL
jgi:hypothetical protein